MKVLCVLAALLFVQGTNGWLFWSRPKAARRDEPEIKTKARYDDFEVKEIAAAEWMCYVQGKDVTMSQAIYRLKLYTEGNNDKRKRVSLNNPTIAFFAEADNGKVCRYNTKDSQKKKYKPLDKNIQIWKSDKIKYVVSKRAESDRAKLTDDRDMLIMDLEKAKLKADVAAAPLIINPQGRGRVGWIFKESEKKLVKKA